MEGVLPMKKMITMIMVVVTVFVSAGSAIAASYKNSSDIIYKGTGGTGQGIEGNQIIVQKILEGFRNLSSEIVIEMDSKPGTSELKGLIQSAAKLDPYYGNIIKSYKISGKVSGKVTVTIKPEYLITKDQDDQILNKIKTDIANLNIDGKSVVDKLKALNSYVKSIATYSTETQGSCYSPYTLIAEKKGVCQSYTLYFIRCCQYLGIDCKYVSGTAKNESHAWCKVKVDGVFKNIDVTWNDCLDSDEYFLLTDAQISKTHTAKN